MTNTTMFDPQQQRIADNYLQVADTAGKAALELAKILINTFKKIQEILKEREEIDKIAVEVGKDTYNLVPDETTPGAYKWEKVDLNQEVGSRDTVVFMPDMYMDNVQYSMTVEYNTQNEPSKYQAQTIAALIVQDVPDLGDNYTTDYEPVIKITAYTESGEKTIIYEQDSKGKCRINLVTENLSQDEIIDVAYEPIVKLLPPSSDMIPNYQSPIFLESNSNFQYERNVNNQLFKILINQLKHLSIVANDKMSSQLLNNNKMEEDATYLMTTDAKDIQSLEYTPIEDAPPSEETVVFLEDIDISNPPDFDDAPDEDEKIIVVIQNNEETELIDNTGATFLSKPSNQIDNQPSNIENTNSIVLIISEKAEEKFEESVINNLQEEVENHENYTSEEKITNNKKPVEEESPSRTPKRENLEEEEQYTGQYTYQQAANSEGVEPQAQQWARQVEVPVYEIKNKRAEKERYNGENKDIVQAATEMLKKYKTIEQDGSRIYRSDAFVIRQEGDTISIHRRSDELQGWNNSLIEFKPGKANKEPKITKQPKEMLGVERQEFLMVNEHLQDKGKLPDLNSSDIRDVANTLGSLAPAGTIKTLEVFKQNEMLDTLNNILLTAGKDELAVGEFTIKRTRDPQGKKASLQLFKTTEERGTQELVRFDLTKTEAGITKEVSKMNISDYDINQMKFIAQNAQKLNLEQIFGNEQPTAAPAPTPKEQPIQAAMHIPVKVHPYIAEEWANMVKYGGPDWGGAMNQGNAEIQERIKDNDGKLPIAEQREMYFKILTYKTDKAQKRGEQVVDFVPLKDIMNDLQTWRAQEIKIQYTPTEHISSPQRQTVATVTPNVKSAGVEF
ncbi:hypothetical protein DP113_33725 (plasmid) [Brasilonema octagenarum UFV-E1]|uniref:Uncharacterized protein n=3 Tax=Scytonemataceae TaxID=1182 RepID=A0A856MQ48_9CYAN|nr:hypothetical protein [Brasilonema octagenarum UFV-OR1]QDL12689.1 hypothetical protein DP114_33620 [Brasilonema sennae CENA114]QDL19083.1 hypothetical protein DP113_33725 [Brasilonema octagenarum UFV-E1]